LAQDECNSLVAFIRELPRPADRTPASAVEANAVVNGRTLFGAIGCASCHSPKLGEVNGLYSDLLLHDMGPQLGDTGQYGVFDPSSSEEEIKDETGPIAGAGGDDTVVAGGGEVVTSIVAVEQVQFAGQMAGMGGMRPMMGGAIAMGSMGKRPTSGPASRFEWRTPALGGFR